jgi:hypothetical protein
MDFRYYITTIKKELEDSLGVKFYKGVPVDWMIVIKYTWLSRVWRILQKKGSNFIPTTISSKSLHLIYVYTNYKLSKVEISVIFPLK